MHDNAKPCTPNIGSGALAGRGHDLGLRQPPNHYFSISHEHPIAPAELDSRSLTGSTTVEGGTEVCNVPGGDAEIPPDCGQIRQHKPLRAIARRQLVSGIDAWIGEWSLKVSQYTRCPPIVTIDHDLIRDGLVSHGLSRDWCLSAAGGVQVEYCRAVIVAARRDYLSFLTCG